MEPRPLSQAAPALSRQMMRYWAAFARTGDPNVRDLARWPRFEPGVPSGVVLRPSGNTVTTGITAEHNCAFWAGLPT